MKHWMLFRTETSCKYYFWNGRYAVWINPTFESTHPANHHDMMNLTDAEKKGMEEAAANKRKKLFTMKRIPQRLIVEVRGTFTEPEN